MAMVLTTVMGEAFKCIGAPVVPLIADLRPAQGGQKAPAQRRCKKAHLVLIFCASGASASVMRAADLH